MTQLRMSANANCGLNIEPTDVPDSDEARGAMFGTETRKISIDRA